MSAKEVVSWFCRFCLTWFTAASVAAATEAREAHACELMEN